MARSDLRDRILAHLWDHDGRASSGGGARSQRGTAQALDITQGQVSRALAPLVSLGLIRHEIGRVTDRRRRVQLYALTRRGRSHVDRAITEGEPVEPEFALAPGFLGRDGELSRLKDHIEGQGGLFWVTGPPGIGKTALVRKALGDRGYAYVSTQPGMTMEGVLNALAKGAAHRQPFLPFLVSSATDGNQAMERLLAALIGSGLVTVVDRVERMDEDTLATLIAWGDRFQLAGGHLILISRDAAQDGDTIQVGPLAKEDMVELARNLSDGSEISTAILEAGNPLHLDLESGSIDRSDLLADLGAVQQEVLIALSLLRVPVPARVFVGISGADQALTALLDRRLILGLRTGGRIRFWLPDRHRELIAGPADPARYHRMAARYFRQSRSSTDLVEAIYHLMMAGDQAGVGNLLRRRATQILEEGLFRELAAAMAGLDVDALAKLDQAPVLILQGNIAESLGDPDQAHLMFTEVLQRSALPPKVEAHALRRLATLAFRSGRTEEAEDLYRQALTSLGKDPDPREAAAIHDRLAVVVMRSGRLEEASREFAAAEAAALGSRDPLLMARIILNRGDLHRRQGDLVGAEEACSQALIALGKHPAASVRAMALTNRGMIRNRLGMTNKAIRDLEEGCWIAKANGDIRAVYGLNNLAYLQLRRGRFDKANEVASECLDLATLAGIQVLISTSNNIIGRIALIGGSIEDAMICFETSRAIRERLGDAEGTAGALINLGDCHLEDGDPASAARFYSLAIDQIPADSVIGIQARLNSALAACLVGDPRSGRQQRASIREVPTEFVWLGALVDARLAEGEDELIEAGNILRSAKASIKVPHERLTLLQALADIEVRSGRVDRARSAWGQAVRVYRAMGLDERADALVSRLLEPATPGERDALLTEAPIPILDGPWSE